jgi:hypothetical protein
VNPPANDPHLSERAADTLELLTKATGLLGLVWAFMAKVLRPYHERRREHQVRTIREAMVPVLAPILKDHDVLVEIALDNRDRHDETNALLDFLGFTSDRRTNEERRDEVTEMVHGLAERRRERRRNLDP